MFNIQDDKRIEIYRNMLLVRAFENAVAALFADKTTYGTTHLCIGQEAVAAGVCAALHEGDYIMSNHRGHGHSICLGTDITAMFAEILGRANGCCKGKGGSMHISDFSRGNLGSTGIVGGGLPIAAGAAMACKMQKKNNVTVCFFGDGASNEGTFHESLNLAAVLKLPVIFVCENNQYAMSTPVDRHTNAAIVQRASGYGITGVSVDGNDAPRVYRATAEARVHALENGPALLVCDTYRTCGHSRSDIDDSLYRSPAEVERWTGRDPLDIMKNYLIDNHLLTERQTADIRRDTEARVKNALSDAKASPYPNADALYAEVFTDGK